MMLTRSSDFSKLQKQLLENLQRFWGYKVFRPLQDMAVRTVIEKRDSLVIMPTGGGKSLCYQLPIMSMPGFAVVVSPLISLMKDQVDSLVEAGIPAAKIDSTQTWPEQKEILAYLAGGHIKILYVSPERLCSDGFLAFLREQPVTFIAIDEAHCVSMWGHDFRPEYRKLGELREYFPDIAIHAFTATATEQVSGDIVRQLNLKKTEIIKGCFDRPNLNYKVQRRSSMMAQVQEVLERHKNESGVIYCIRRKEVESLCKKLNKLGYRAEPYHAGMDDSKRKRSQDRFISDRVDIIVATIAFGMGIDKSNVRFVIHTGMPKSIENYQQESGRAGRDGLEAECVLLYSGSDYHLWKTIMSDLEGQPRKISMSKLSDIYRFCTTPGCRHKSLLNYFGQSYEAVSCNACDMCLEGGDIMENSLILSQKILSSVARLKNSFGAEYNSLVLKGSSDKRIVENGHDKLSTFSLLSQYSKETILEWIEQLSGQGYINRDGEFAQLAVTELGWESLKGTKRPCLLKPRKKLAQLDRSAKKLVGDNWDGVDKDLFESLRGLRSEIARERNLPPFVVFSDVTLRDMARKRPSDNDRLLAVHGVGQSKRKKYGTQFLDVISKHCQEHGIGYDVEEF